MEPRALLAEAGCILEGDYFFALKSGRVSTKYINIDPLLTIPVVLEEVMLELGTKVSVMSNIMPPSVIAGPAIGAIPLAYAFERMLMPNGLRLGTVFAEKEGTEFSLQRAGFKEMVKDQLVFIVEDITSTGQSSKKTAEAIEAAGGHITGYGFIWNRAPSEVTQMSMGAPVINLIEESVQSWLPEEHPQWGTWPLVADIGHPEHFSDYPGPRATLLS